MKKRALTKTLPDTSEAIEERPSITADNGRHDLIMMKAYELYEQRGCLDGHALDDWMQAELIVQSKTE